MTNIAAQATFESLLGVLDEAFSLAEGRAMSQTQDSAPGWWEVSSSASPGSARVLRGPRVSAIRPASLLVDPEKLRRFAPRKAIANGNGHVHPDLDSHLGGETGSQGEALSGSADQVDPAVEAARLEQLEAWVAEERAKAAEEAYERGLAEGKAAARAELEESNRLAEQRREGTVQSAAMALLRAVEQVEESRQEAVRVAEQECAELAFKLTRAIVAREMQLSENPTVDSIMRALELAPTNEAVVVRLNPDDIATLSGFDMSQVGRECTIVPDESVEHSGCVVEVGPTRIDAQLGRALGRVRKALLGLGHDHVHDLTEHGVSYSDVSAHTRRTSSASVPPVTIDEEQGVA
jgi:flagellar assembly protein FliH